MNRLPLTRDILRIALASPVPDAFKGPSLSHVKPSALTESFLPSELGTSVEAVYIE